VGCDLGETEIFLTGFLDSCLSARVLVARKATVAISRAVEVAIVGVVLVALELVLVVAGGRVIVGPDGEVDVAYGSVPPLNPVEASGAVKYPISECQL
jgi:hypothetical protein